VTTIRSDGRVSDGTGNHAEYAFSYVSFEHILDAFEVLRDFNARYGFYERDLGGKETFNLGIDKGALSPARQAGEPPPGLALPYTLAKGKTPHPSPPRTERKPVRPRVRILSTTGVEVSAEGPREHLRNTNGAHATLNALARALAEGRTDGEGYDAPHLTEGWLPETFADFWTIRDAPEGEEAEWSQGAVRALQAFNLGTQIDPLKLLRGDVVQMGATKVEPLLGQPGFAFGVRRVRAGEVRFVYISSQPDTFGVGVPINDLARRGLVEREMGLNFRASLADEDGVPLTDHRYEVEVSGEIFEGRSDERGRLEIALPTGSKTGTMRFWLDEGTEDEELIEWPLRFGKGKPAVDQGDDGDADEVSPTADEDDEANEDEDFGKHDPTAISPDERKQEDGPPPCGVARKEWVVSRSGAPTERFVYHPDAVDSPRFVTHALRYGKWQHLTPGKEDDHRLFHPWHGVALACRPHIEFPRYPLALGGTSDLAYSTDAATGKGWETVPLVETLERYYRNTEDLKGGYFPIGRSRIWHNGVHLEPEKGARLVGVPFDGRVVAARIGAYEEQLEGEEPRYPFGSPNFVLLKHGVEVDGTAHEFFTLLMHVAPIPLALLGNEQILTPEAARIPWIRDIALAPDRDLDVERTQDLDPDKLYLEVTGVPETEYPLGEDGPPLEVGDFLEVAGAEVNELQWQVFNGNKSGPAKRASDGAQAEEFSPSHFLAAGGSMMPFDAYSLRFKDIKRKLLEGEVVDLWDEKIVIRCGEPIADAGLWHANERLHVEVFSQDLIPIKIAGAVDASTGEATMTAKAAVDCDTAGDATVFYDRLAFQDKFFEDVETKGNEADGFDGEELALRVRKRMLANTVAEDDCSVLLEGEIQAFFNNPTNTLLPLFRNLVVRHLSEWGTKVKWEDLSKAKAALGEPLEGALETVGKQGARYAWWSEGLCKDAGLPSDQVAHFYHPVTFLRWLEYERRQELEKGQAEALHKSVFDLNHDIFEEGGGPGPDAGTQHLKLSLADEDGDALEDCRYELRVDGELFTGTSGEGGRIEHDVPAAATVGELEFWIDEDESYIWPLKIR
jgi:hypothetical protein